MPTHTDNLRNEHCNLCGAFKRLRTPTKDVHEGVCERCYNTRPVQEYRCTRNELYTHPSCPGHEDLTARQGYYIKALTEEQALRVMCKDFPHDTEGFTATNTKELS